MRPSLTERQTTLLSCYYKARRESEDGKRVRASDIQAFTESIPYEQDIAIYILQKVDDHYLKLCADDLKRKAGKNDR